MELNDAGSAALELTYRLRVGAAFLAKTEAGQCLIEIGLRDDLKHCAQLDRYRVVPEMEDRVIRVPTTSSKASKLHRDLGTNPQAAKPLVGARENKSRRGS